MNPISIQKLLKQATLFNLKRPSIHVALFWKARLAGYETLIIQFQLAEDDEVFTELNCDHQWPHKAVTDSNAVAQEKGVLLVLIYIRLAGRAGSRCQLDCITPLVDKSFATSTRKGTREAAIEFLLEWAMSEADGDKAKGIVTAVFEGLNLKQLKVVAGAAAALNTRLISNLPLPEPSDNPPSLFPTDPTSNSNKANPLPPVIPPTGPEEA
ncbi:hypothetical protein PtA15_2A570 [Puccinia triticina]|uniref:XMAP215/Dis1/CLASP TOG domain-containing protein n=1 Tax=Puccinia triticina TaxID=208348 RepID=A0ABY7CAP8_9BASI|nr:uncharacterized protein PtA15_2A570 [Puccinia triticina]WAQ82253.1 hypothetical protein PtA15_2A570 [Puccinia triticina]